MKRNIYKDIFVAYLLIILGATLWLMPGWGFMDDYQNLQTGYRVFAGKESFWHLVYTDVSAWGRLRPLYSAWILFTSFFQTPVLIYILITLLNFICLLIWGKIASRIWEPTSDKAFLLFGLPLAVFIFTPFWNIFMYISVQEKFVFWFGTVSLWFFIDGLTRSRKSHILFALLLAFLGTLGKETGVSLMACYVAFCALDAFWWKQYPLSRWALIPAIALCGGYILYVKGILGSYTEGYKNRLNVGDMFKTFGRLPLVIKGIATVGVAGLIVSAFGPKERPSKFYFLMPAFVLAYFILLLPWGFSHYLLAPIAPFLAMSCYGLADLVVTRRPKLQDGLKVITILLALIVLVAVIIPRINKMAEKRQVVEAVKALDAKHPQSCFFYPPPVDETAGALKAFSKANVASAKIVKPLMLSSCKEAFVLTNDESDEMPLAAGVSFGSQVYRSHTWLIRKLYWEVRP